MSGRSRCASSSRLGAPLGVEHPLRHDQVDVLSLERLQRARHGRRGHDRQFRIFGEHRLERGQDVLVRVGKENGSWHGGSRVQIGLSREIGIPPRSFTAEWSSR